MPRPALAAVKMTGTPHWNLQILSASKLDPSAARPLPSLEVRILFPLAFIVIFSSAARAQPAVNCQFRATPPPLATFGGPATAAPGQTELGIAVGAYGEGFGSMCFTDLAGAEDWFIRWRRGITERLDLGFDLLADNRSDGKLDATIKGAVRYQVTRGFRVEAGTGAADGGGGRSLNADLAGVIGTTHLARTWNYYASLRLAGSHGCVNLLCVPGSAPPGSRPPGAVIPLGAIGSTARISDHGHFVMEAGLGGIFSHEYPGHGLYIHLSFGLLFDVGRKSN